MKNLTEYLEIELNKSTLLFLGVFAVLFVLGLLSALHMEHEGHYVTGMTNQIVWGLPHVFAVFLIVAASGALNIASIGTVFDKKLYKPLGRVSSWIAIALLVGGLMVLVLDLGRPDRLIVAMTSYNFKSIFAWNMILYNGFFLITGIYLWFMIDRQMQKHYQKVGLLAFVWRLLLTMGTGSIFGFIVARTGFNTALLAPMFIVMSFSFGLAFVILLVNASCMLSGREMGDKLQMRLKNLLGVFIASVFFFVVVYHMTNLYWAKNLSFESFVLLDGGIYPLMFWAGQIGLGTFLPLALIYSPFTSKSRFWIMSSAVLVIIGGLAQMYVIIIGGQAFPMPMFPDKEVTSTFFDGVVASYTPSIWEAMLGIAGVCLTVLVSFAGMWVLRLLPQSLSDQIVDPAHNGK